MSTALILNLALSAAVLALIIGELALSIATQHRDRGPERARPAAGDEAAFRAARHHTE
jgi:hypothetical protein